MWDVPDPDYSQCIYIVNILTDMTTHISLIVSVSREELARALARGTLVVPLDRAAGFGTSPGAQGEGLEAGLDEATIARICALYGPETLAANLLWEIAQAGDGGLTASELKATLGLTTSKALAGVFSGLGKTLAREVPGREHLFIERAWQRDGSEYRYRMPGPVRTVVARAYG
jgi:hypothetical protein